MNKYRTILNVQSPAAPPSPNTLIGGQGATTTTAADLETLLGLSPGDVTYFNLSGNDIEAFISPSYSLPASAFYPNSVITSFEDLEGKVTSAGDSAFRDCSALIKVDLPGMTSVGNSFLHGCTVCNDTNLPLVATAGVAFLRGIAEVDVNCPSLASCSNSSFRDLTLTDSINIPLCTGLGATSGSGSVFQLIKIGATITCPVFLQTNNGGGRDGDIAYAEDNRSCTIIYV